MCILNSRPRQDVVETPRIMGNVLEVPILRSDYYYRPSDLSPQTGQGPRAFYRRHAGRNRTPSGLGHIELGRYTRTRRTTSPLTSSAAGIDMIDRSRTTRQEGGIMARKDARMASDFCSW